MAIAMATKIFQPIAMAHPIAQDPLSKEVPIGWGAIKTHCTKTHSVAASRRLKSSGGMEWLGVWNCFFSGSDFFQISELEIQIFFCGI